MLGLTYGARMARGIVEELGMKCTTQAHPTADRMAIYASGLRVELPPHPEHGACFLSLQTHPMIAGSAFAETALVGTAGIVYPSELGYHHDVIRHHDPAELREHLQLLRDELGKLVPKPPPTAPPAPLPLGPETKHEQQTAPSGTGTAGAAASDKAEDVAEASKQAEVLLQTLTSICASLGGNQPPCS